MDKVLLSGPLVLQKYLFRTGTRRTTTLSVFGASVGSLTTTSSWSLATDARSGSTAAASGSPRRWATRWSCVSGSVKLTSRHCLPVSLTVFIKLSSFFAIHKSYRLKVPVSGSVLLTRKKYLLASIRSQALSTTLQIVNLFADALDSSTTRSKA